MVVVLEVVVEPEVVVEELGAGDAPVPPSVRSRPGRWRRGSRHCFTDLLEHPWTSARYSAPEPDQFG